jgi:hypothetical protein
MTSFGNLHHSLRHHPAYWQLGFVATMEEKYAEAGMYWSRAREVSEQILGGTTFLGFGGSRGVE